MNETLVLLELLIQGLHVDVVAGLHAEELEIVYLLEKLDVLEILAGVAGQLFMGVIASCTKG